MPKKILFKLIYGLLRPLPPAQPINRLRGLIVGMFLKKSGRNLRIYNNVTISNPQNISIGDHVVINPGCFLATSSAEPAEIIIGNDCLIAPRCFLETLNHNFDDPDTPIREQGSRAAPIHIGDDCWLAYGVVVLPGVTIGKGCVIGAYGLVNRDTPPFSINVGNPVRQVGTRGKKRTRNPAREENGSE